jgi:hypothetical protein
MAAAPRSEFFHVLRAGLDIGEIRLGYCEQFVALARTLFSQQRVAAHHPPFAGKVELVISAVLRWSNNGSSNGPPRPRVARLPSSRAR